MSTKPTVLIVEDEKNTREGLARALKPRYQVHLAENGQKALELLHEVPIDLVLSDIRMPGMDGLTLMQRTLALTPQPICILLTAYGTIETAVDAMKRGAYDFLTKPVNLDRLELLLKRALRSRDIENENSDLRRQLDKKYGLEQLIGESPPMQELFETVSQVAPSRATLLISGESGTGKELVAHAVHRLSPRKQGPFIAVHCAALPAALLESELFGHEKGAFTGAEERRKGRFELADGGSLFLDEIGEIDSSVQVKILRVLEEKSFERVGGQQTLDVDVRVIAATNKDLKQLVEEDLFREDLYYRLNVVEIEIPPLRERKGDIPLLLHQFITTSSRENQKPVNSVTSEALDLLVQYEWPGNVRELRNMVERMVVLAKGDKLTLRDIPIQVRKLLNASSPIRPNNELSLEHAEKEMIIQALKNHAGNKTKAACQLGISRRTLHRKLNEYGLKETRES